MPIPPWHDRGLCRMHHPDIFFEQDYEDQAVAICAMCPVKAECLTWAIETKQEYGTWGGLTERERRKARTKRTRVKCPGCGSPEVQPLPNSHELCLACGLTWPI